MTIKTDFREGEIVKLTAEIVQHLVSNEADIEIKIAALRASADVLQQSVMMKGLAAALINALTPRS